MTHAAAGAGPGGYAEGSAGLGRPAVRLQLERGPMLPRQARLRSAFSDWYPGITPDQWHHAVWVREMALSGLRNGGPQWQLEGRVLSDAHFEFRGGIGDRGAPARDGERRMLRSGS